MNWDRVEGKWKQYSGKAKEKWGKLTDDDLTTISGKRDQLIGKVQERYGIAKDQAEAQVDEFTASLSDTDTRESHKTRGAGF
ncbi:MAG: CsbD family protein [Candidatus Acidiferrum sp.]